MTCISLVDRSLKLQLLYMHLCILQSRMKINTKPNVCIWHINQHTRILRCLPPMPTHRETPRGTPRFSLGPNAQYKQYLRYAIIFCECTLLFNVDFIAMLWASHVNVRLLYVYGYNIHFECNSVIVKCSKSNLRMRVHIYVCSCSFDVSLLLPQCGRWWGSGESPLLRRCPWSSC